MSSLSNGTESGRAERALRASEERFRATFFQAAVGIARISVDGEWLLVNDSFCEVFGYTPAELQKKSFLDVTHLDEREELRLHSAAFWVARSPHQRAR